jgi:hypothetical protein
MGPISALREEWSVLWDEGQAGGTPADQLIYWLAQELGTSPRLDPQARDYLLSLVAARGPDAPLLCRIERVRWLSPATVVVEAVHDLADHSSEERKALREFLSLHAPLAGDDEGSADGILPLSGLIATWIGARGLSVR